ncbi:MAG: primosomal protein N' [Acholeplasmatales bacterium]|jgi:primosomal protein N' (replication factor Y)|nr:primosomal protein N' [Acholeplasmatales bacterium]
MRLAVVIIDIPHNLISSTYEYLIPESLDLFVLPGCRVLVPFGVSNKLRMAYIFRIIESYDDMKATKAIDSLIDYTPSINAESFALISFMNERNIAPLFMVIKTIIPNELNYKYKKSYYLKETNFMSTLLKFNKKSRLINDHELSAKTLKGFLDSGVLGEQYIVKSKSRIKIEKYYTLAANISLEYLNLYPALNDLSPLNSYSHDALELLGLSRSNLQTLVRKKILIVEERQKEYNLLSDAFQEKKEITFNEEQQVVFERICHELYHYHTFLLKGVTGSGKTEIYLKLIAEVLKSGRNVMLLTPEITLVTPLLTRILALYSDIILWHSLLSANQRFKAWTDIKNNQARIIIGTRSACFLPIDNLGLIIMDEEHDKSYLQSQAVSYDTHEIVDLRAKYHNCCLILGSATPALDTYFQVESGAVDLLELNHQASNLPLSQLVVVNLTDSENVGSLLSPYLVKEMAGSLARHEQIILLHTIKGNYKTYHCSHCGYYERCPNCDVSLTYYKTSNKLRCHYCGYTKDFSERCPNCLNILDSQVIGINTVHETLAKVFPQARILQADKSLITSKDDYEQIYLRFKNHEYDILLGTQMISKGLDFANVSLAAIINADYLLNSPSYDAIETTYQLLSQFRGRSGRSLQGKTIIQTSYPQNLSIQALSNSYDDYYVQALDLRFKGGLNPYYKIYQFIVVGILMQEVFAAGKEFSNILRKLGKFLILGPTLAMIPKLNKKLRTTITLKVPSQQKLNIGEIKQIVVEFLKKHPKVEIHFRPFLSTFI